MGDEFDIIVDVLDESTCWRLMSRSGFGRLGFMHGDELMVLPVNAAVSENRVVFRTTHDSMFARVGDGTKVVFEVDQTDRVAESGWSVLLRGRLWDVTGRPETATWQELSVHPWAQGARDRWMAIEPTAVSGRRVLRHRTLPPGVHPSYMPPD
ncbi:MAG TPA: pyridoxamine 5'-phosphate oxidase family protein [Ilumatobacteraceae bacterium]